MGERPHFASAPPALAGAIAELRRLRGGAPAAGPAQIRGLTLWRPWDWAIARIPAPKAKRIENRGWRYPASMQGGFVAIHGGKKYDEDSALTIATTLGMDSEIRVPDDETCPEGITAVARLAYCFDGDFDRLAEVLGEEQARYQVDTWLSTEPGNFGWVLTDVVALPQPIPCRGAQGLWALPKDVLERVRAAYKEARS